MNKFGCRGYQDKVGILLAQLGTPDAPTPHKLRKYLKQFLSDRRVIEVNKYLWWFILNGIILNTRPKRSAENYSRIWTKDGSPLLLTTKKQAETLAQSLADSEIVVRFGMRYGNPSLENVIDEMLAKGVRRLLLLPLFPQYAAATSASAYDVVFPKLLKERWVPTLRVAAPYFLHPEYIAAQAEVINESLSKLASAPERLLLSYHGVPKSYIDKGDPYCCMCTETTAAIKQKINFPKERVIHCYQSRFGKDPWLTPYTDETIIKLAREGVKKIAIAAPAFVSDCLETIDELGRENHEVFKQHGGEELTLIPCLNDHSRWLKALETIVKEELGNWLIPIKSSCSACPST